MEAGSMEKEGIAPVVNNCHCDTPVLITFLSGENIDTTRNEAVMLSGSVVFELSASLQAAFSSLTLRGPPAFQDSNLPHYS